MTWSLISSLETVVLLGKGILVPEVTLWSLLVQCFGCNHPPRVICQHLCHGPCLGLQEAVCVLWAEGCMEASRSVFSILSVHLKSNLKLK